MNFQIRRLWTAIGRKTVVAMEVGLVVSMIMPSYTQFPQNQLTPTQVVAQVLPVLATLLLGEKASLS